MVGILNILIGLLKKWISLIQWLIHVHTFLKKMLLTNIWFICVLVLICLFFGKFICVFFFSSKKLADPIFKYNIELKKEYRFLVEQILPLLNDCGYCGVLKGKYCLNFSVNCSMCLKDKCQNCYQSNKSKDILINCRDEQISNYI